GAGYPIRLTRGDTDTRESAMETTQPSGNKISNVNLAIELSASPHGRRARYQPFSRRGKLMRKLVAAVFALVSIGIFVTEALAKPVVVARLVSTKTAIERNCMIDG